MQKKTAALLASTGIAGLVAGGVMMTGFSANAADDSGTGTPSPGSYGAPPSGQPGRAGDAQTRESPATRTPATRPSRSAVTRSC